MNEWSGFATLFAQIEPFVRGSVDAIITALASYIGPALKWGLIAYASGRLLMRALMPSGNPLAETELLLVKGSIALYLATNAAVYTSNVRDLLLYGIPNQVTAAIAGANGERAITAGVFDDVWNQAWAAGAAVVKNLSWTDFTLAILVALYLIIAMVSILAAFVIWFKAFLFLSLLIAVGPLFIGLFVFPVLRSLTRGWFASIMANIVLQILAVALLSILLGAETRIVSQIAALYRSGGNVVTQVQLLLALMMVFLVCGFLAVMLPGLANSITGGFAAGSNGGGGFGWFRGSSGGGRSRPGGGGSGAGGSGNGAPLHNDKFIGKIVPGGRPNTPPGRSLSRSRPNPP